jgi:hypothetical protein
MNRKQFEAYLNQLYAEQDNETVYDQLIYLTVKTRNGGHISKNRLRQSIQAGKAGTILRKYDPIAFTCAYNNQK